MTDAHQHYAQQEIMTASPAKLVYMMYARAIQNLKESIQAIEDGNIEKRFKKNKKAFDIIMHMWRTLDMENGGEIAQNLDKLFSYILGRLPDIDMKNDPEPAREVIKLLEPICESWRQLMAGEATQPQSPQTSAYPQEDQSQGGNASSSENSGVFISA